MCAAFLVARHASCPQWHGLAWYPGTSQSQRGAALGVRRLVCGVRGHELGPRPQLALDPSEAFCDAAFPRDDLACLRLLAGVPLVPLSDLLAALPFLMPRHLMGQRPRVRQGDRMG